MWVDKMTRKQLSSGEFVCGDTEVIKVFSAINGASAVVKLASVNGDDFSTNGVYSTGSGLTLLPGEQHEGSYSKITVSSGMVEFFISSVGQQLG